MMSISEQYMQAEMAYIHASGLFLADWYVERHPELAKPGADPLGYFCKVGWRQGDFPNPYFDPAHYLAVNQDVARAGLNPLLHYVTHGDKEGRDPCAYFHAAWYREQYQVPAGETALKHFLDRRFTGEVAPVPMFDPVYYFENNPDVVSAGSDPFEHFLAFGAAEARNPSAEFDMRFYTARYGAVLGGLNPLLHYLANWGEGAFFPARPEHEKLIPGAVKHATRPGALFEEFRPVPAQAKRRAKLLAFYLPQFHQVPENDAWWGKGFTDWTNLARGLPRFAGHLQPRVPRDLGFYALDNPEVLRKQIALAQGAGLGGFVFHFYWFNRQRLLDAPLQALLADETLVFPFCVSWANENWTRRWDGLEREVLLAQEYRESDDEALIACFAGLFADHRYIRINGRPLLMIYRAALIPDAGRRIAAWRMLFEKNHGENPIMVMVQSLGDANPTPYGLDGAVEFPPHQIADELVPVNDRLDLFDPEFSARVYEYEDVAAASLAVPRPDYPLIKTIAPGWDNDPRREGKGLVLHGATPAKYQAWLAALVTQANEKPFYGEPIICVNAWNEWAEGAFLEPDVHFGAAFLNATGRAICETASHAKVALLMVGHDAHPHGAQMNMLNLARHYRQVCGIDVHVLLLGPGALLPEFQKTANVSLTNDKAMIAGLLDRYVALGIRTAIVNSAASTRLVPALAAHGIAVTLLIHEMPNLLAEYNLQMQAKLGALAARRVVFSAAYPKQRFCEALQIELDNATILPQGNYKKIRYSASARAEVRRAFGVPDTAFVVLGVGFADLRKGFDLFLQIARYFLSAHDDVYFLWVGEIQPLLRAHLGNELAAATATGRFLRISFNDDVGKYYSASDVYALTSREDPYPTVAMEAIACGVPVVAFDKSGGVPEMLRQYAAGVVAEYGSPEDFKDRLAGLLHHDTLELNRPRLIKLAEERFSASRYAQDLLCLAQPDLKTVSVCVVNYNYARYLKQRLNSVFAQTYPVAEILFFDDGSGDGSRHLAKAIAAEQGRGLRSLANLQNAGQILLQWQSAVAAASGEYVWIAEADDDCDPQFLSRVIEAMTCADDVLLGFSDSAMIDAAGEQIAPNYQSHYHAAGAAMLGTSGVWPAGDFALQCLAIQNLIYNVSAVVWRRDVLLEALQRCGESLRDWKIAGDWRLYIEALTQGKGRVAYVAAPLNHHRRHADSATQAADAERHLDEIQRMQTISAEKCGLDPVLLTKQQNYLHAVKKSFSVSKTANQQEIKSVRATKPVVARKPKV
jgi:glycosyltransferase involved in cell wall biosynthesis